MIKEFQVAICPHCGNESVHIPIKSWDTSFEQKTGIQGFFPVVDLDLAECTKGCFLTRSDRFGGLEVVDHAWSDE